MSHVYPTVCVVNKPLGHRLCVCSFFIVCFVITTRGHRYSAVFHLLEDFHQVDFHHA